MKIKGSTIFAMVIMAIMLFMIIWAQVKYEFFHTKILPMVLASAVLILSAVSLRRDLAADKAGQTNKIDNVESGIETRVSWGTYLRHVIWVAGLVIGIFILGFLVSLPVFMLFYTRWLGTRWRVALPLATIFIVVAYLVFERILGIPFYRGLVFIQFF